MKELRSMIEEAVRRAVKDLVAEAITEAFNGSPETVSQTRKRRSDFGVKRGPRKKKRAKRKVAHKSP